MELVRRSYARWLALVAATAIVLYLCWLMIQPFVDVLLWASVLAIVARPVQARLRRAGHSASVSAMITTALVVMTVLIPLTLITAAVVQQGAGAADSLHEGVKRLLNPESAAFKWVSQYVDLTPLLDPKVLGSRLSSVWGAVANRTLGLVGGFVGGMVQVFFVLFTLYYLLRDSGVIMPAIRRSLPLTEAQADVIFERTGEVISASVNGVLVISAIQGFLGMIAFLVLGLPSALLWGVMMFLLSTIPMAGSAIVWGPAAIYLFATGHWIKAVMLVTWGGVVIGLIDNILRPRLVGKRAKLHELIIFFSVLGGLQVFGVLGLFVGPVVAAIALALVEVFQRSEAEERSEKEDKSGPPHERLALEHG
ncbi:MAG: family transporter [Phycisphaerales bacterium]|nr:family transporter [Phycisphaerales bacterium]